MKRILFYLSLVFLFSFSVYADSNGIWHFANDIRGGIFGSDELGETTNYTFIHPVYFNVNVYYKNILLEDMFVEENQVDSVSSAMIIDGTIISADLNLNNVQPSINYWTKIGNNLNYDLGNVGIGVDIPTAKLDVDGKIRMRSQTQDTDSDDTLITKKYFEDEIANLESQISSSGVSINVSSCRWRNSRPGTLCNYAAGEVNVGTLVHFNAKRIDNYCCKLI